MNSTYYENVDRIRTPNINPYSRVEYREGLYVGYRGYEKNNVEPLFPFGFGLSYSAVKYSEVKLDKTTINAEGTVKASAVITNTGSRPVTETAQLYIRDLVASSVRPVWELKSFQRVTLKPRESKRVTFTLGPDELAFYNQNVEYVVEPGQFHVWIAPHAEAGKPAEFTVR